MVYVANAPKTPSPTFRPRRRTDCMSLLQAAVIAADELMAHRGAIEEKEGRQAGRLVGVREGRTDTILNWLSPR